MKRVVLCVTFLTLFSLFLSGCNPPNIDNMPTAQNNTTWEETNGKVYIVVDDNHVATGYLNVNNEIIEVYFYMNASYPYHNFSISPISAYNQESGRVVEPEKTIEFWNAVFYAENEFAVTVDESTYFRKGEEFVFYRTHGTEDGSLSHEEKALCQ